MLGEGLRALVSLYGDEKVLLDYIMGVLFRLSQSYVLRGMKEPLTKQANVLFEMLWRAIAKSP